MTTLTKLMVRASLCLAILTLSGASTVGECESVEWVPYTTQTHSYIGNRIGFAGRINNYLIRERKLSGPELIKEFNRWYRMNLGHIFEEAVLSSYGVLKNYRLFNGRIPDGVENGSLEQILQYTDYPSSTFIEAKCMSAIRFLDPRISGQLKDMIDFLSTNDQYTTTKRFFNTEYNRMPGRASTEGLAVLVFLTPENCIIANDIIQYAEMRRVKVYQMKTLCNPANEVEIKLGSLNALTSRSLHFHGHVKPPKPININWNKRIIDPDTGQEIIGY